MSVLAACTCAAARASAQPARALELDYKRQRRQRSANAQSYTNHYITTAVQGTVVPCTDRKYSCRAHTLDSRHSHRLTQSQPYCTQEDRATAYAILYNCQLSRISSSSVAPRMCLRSEIVIAKRLAHRLYTSSSSASSHAASSWWACAFARRAGVLPSLSGCMCTAAVRPWTDASASAKEGRPRLRSVQLQ